MLKIVRQSVSCFILLDKMKYHASINNNVHKNKLREGVGSHSDGMNTGTDDGHPLLLSLSLPPSILPHIPSSLTTWSQRAVTPKGRRE